MEQLNQLRQYDYIVAPPKLDYYGDRCGRRPRALVTTNSHQVLNNDAHIYIYIYISSSVG